MHAAWSQLHHLWNPYLYRSTFGKLQILFREHLTNFPKVALTSPDPDISTDARDFFARHMRILEKCLTAWPMPDMQQQIDALREAFSADLTKPFELKATFPYGSPREPSQSSPRGSQGSLYNQPHLSTAPIDMSAMDQQSVPHSQMMYSSHPITPPVSAGGVDTKSDSATQSLVMMPGQRVQPSMASTVPMVDPGWNPSRIFE